MISQLHKQYYPKKSIINVILYPKRTLLVL